MSPGAGHRKTLHRARAKFEIFFDFFQAAIVVGLVYSTFFFPRSGCCPPMRACPPSSRFARIKFPRSAPGQHSFDQKHLARCTHTPFPFT